MILADTELSKLRETLETQANMDNELLQRCAQTHDESLAPHTTAPASRCSKSVAS